MMTDWMQADLWGAEELGPVDPDGEPLRQQWRTPRWLFSYLDRLWGPFELDAYASPGNALCDRFNSRADPDAHDWWMFSAVYGNPPFAMSGDAMDQAARVASMGSTRVALVVPAAVNSRRWHRHRHSCLTLWPSKRIQFTPPPGVKPSTNAGDIAIHIFGELAGEATLDVDWAELEGRRQ